MDLTATLKDNRGVFSRVGNSGNSWFPSPPHIQIMQGFMQIKLFIATPIYLIPRALHMPSGKSCKPGGSMKASNLILTF